MAPDFEASDADNYCARTLPSAIKSASITVVVRAKIESFAGGGYCLTFGEPRGANNDGRGFGLLIATGPQKLQVRFGAAESAAWELVTCNTVLSAGTWYQIAGSFNNVTKDLKGYIDGVEDGSSNKAGKTIQWVDAGAGYPNPGQLYFGAWKTNALGGGVTVPDWMWYDGVIDEVCIFDAALTEAQLQSLRHRRQPWHANLVGYWRMDEESGATLVDLKNGNNATLYNAARVGGGPLTYG